MWTKVRKSTGRKGAPTRTSYAVQTNGKNSCRLLIPGSSHLAQYKRCDILQDGAGRIGFMPCDDGEFAIYQQSKSTKAVTIPAAISSSVPNGTTDIAAAVDGAMVVIDLSQINVTIIAAE